MGEGDIYYLRICVQRQVIRIIDDSSLGDHLRDVNLDPRNFVELSGQLVQEILWRADLSEGGISAGLAAMTLPL
jgi:hypothetical protein